MNGPRSSLDSRRAVLGVFGSAGLAALAGCRDLLPPSNTNPPEESLDRAVLRETVALGTPALPERVPAPITEAYLGTARSRVERLLGTAAEGLPALPEGPARRFARERARRARDDLDGASEAQSRYETVQALRVARSYAAEARAAVLAGRGDLRRAEVLADREPIRARLSAFESGRRYVGGPPASSVVTFRYVEVLSDAATDALGDAEGSPGNADSGAPLVGETAGRVEAARAFLDDATHLYERHRTTTGDTRLASAFGDALAALSTDARTRFDAIPEGFGERPAAHLQGELGGTAAETVLARAYREAGLAVDVATGGRDDHGPAARLLAALEAYRDLEAFERLREAAEAGDLGRVRSAAEVRRAKVDLVGMVTDARGGRHADLTRYALRDPVTTSRGVDLHLRESLEEGGTYGGREAFEDLRFAAARAAAVPSAVGTVAGGLAAASDAEF